MNNVENKLYEIYKEELQNIKIGYPLDSKRIREMYELVMLDNYLHTDYPSESEMIKYLQYYGN